MTEATALPPAEVPNSLALSVMRGAMRLLSATAPSLASRLAVDLFMKPRRYPTPAREQAILTHGTPFNVHIETTAPGLGPSTDIRAWRFGSGPIVVLTHGWEGRGSQLTPFVAPLVERGYSVITFDAPGHGASPGSRSSLPRFAWALRGVADAIGQPHAIIAHSLGCAATTLALRDGLQADRVVFLSPPLNPVDYTARFAEIVGIDDTILRAMQQRVEARFGRKWSDYSLGESAKLMSTPLLVVHDRDDRDTFWSEGAALAKAWPGATLMTTEGLGHRRILRDEAVVADVARFVAGEVRT